MDKSLSYTQPISRYNRSVSLDDWYTSMDCYEKGEYQKSVVHLLRYINPPVTIPDGPDLDITIPHGSVNVHLKMTGENFSVEVPFLKFNSSSLRLPSMRQMIESNFSAMVLAQTVLKGDELWMEYKMPVENCEPYKVYDLLDEMCREADQNDDYYIDRFKLEHISEIKAEPFTQEEREAAAREFGAIISEGLACADYMDGKRYYDMECDALAITLFRLKHSIFPQGILDRDIQDVLSGMYEHQPPETIAAKTKEKMKKLQNYDSNKMQESLYHPLFFMPIKPRADILKVQEQLENCYNIVSKNYSSGAYMYCAMFGIYELYYLCELFTIPPEVMKAVEATLEAISGAEWKTAAEGIYKFLNWIMEIEVDENGEVIKGSLVFRSAKPAKEASSASSKAKDVAKNVAKGAATSGLRGIISRIIDNILRG